MSGDSRLRRNRSLTGAGQAFGNGRLAMVPIAEFHVLESYIHQEPSGLQPDIAYAGSGDHWILWVRGGLVAVRGATPPVRLSLADAGFPNVLPRLCESVEADPPITMERPGTPAYAKGTSRPGLGLGILIKCMYFVQS